MIIITAILGDSDFMSDEKKFGVTSMTRAEGECSYESRKNFFESLIKSRTQRMAVICGFVA